MQLSAGLPLKIVLRMVYKGREGLYKQAVLLRKQNYGYRSIERRLGVHWRTVANWVRGIKSDKRLATIKSFEHRDKSNPEELSSSPAIRRLLIRERHNLCEVCGIGNWLSEPITLELHHINGDGGNNKRYNLQLLCPNCHSQTADYRNRRRSNGETVNAADLKSATNSA